MIIKTFVFKLYLLQGLWLTVCTLINVFLVL